MAEICSLVVHVSIVAYGATTRQNGPGMRQPSLAPKKLSIAFQCRWAASGS
jgi:hypothetical protein